MKYDTYLFDFDGTLVDSMPAYVSAVQKILDKYNIKYEDDIIRIITPLGSDGTAEYFRSIGVNETKEEILKMIGEYVYVEYMHNIEAKKDVVSTLEKLKETGTQLSILTACPHILLDPCLERLGIRELFTNIWSSDDFETSKNDVELYRIIAGKSGKPAGQIIFFDDNLNALKTAKTAGLNVCGVFDEASSDCINDIKAVADYYVYNISELFEMFGK